MGFLLFDIWNTLRDSSDGGGRKKSSLLYFYSPFLPAGSQRYFKVSLVLGKKEQRTTRVNLQSRTWMILVEPSQLRIFCDSLTDHWMWSCHFHFPQNIPLWFHFSLRRLASQAGAGIVSGMTLHAFTPHEIPSRMVKLMRKIAYCSDFWNSCKCFPAQAYAETTLANKLQRVWWRKDTTGSSGEADSHGQTLFLNKLALISWWLHSFL